MSTAPTAEEVLGLYLKWKATVKEFYQGIHKDDEETAAFSWDVINDRNAFQSAVEQWQASQGPVTREWFVGRFGSDTVRIGNLTIRAHQGIGICVYDTRCTIPQCIRTYNNPTRADIETLVRLLGGPVRCDE